MYNLAENTPLLLMKAYAMLPESVNQLLDILLKLHDVFFFLRNVFEASFRFWLLRSLPSDTPKAKELEPILSNDA